MSSNRSNIYKFSILALSIFLLIVLFKGYKDNKYANELQENLKEESLLAQNQLSEIIEKYDSISSLYNNYDDTFSNLVSKATITKTKVNYKNVSDLNLQIQIIKDSINSLQNKLNEFEKIKALVKPEKIKEETVKRSLISNSKFEITNLQVKGVKFLNENTSQTKVKEIEQIRVCFTVDKNEAIKRGEKEIYVQVINPKNAIVSVDHLTYEKNNTTLKYSKVAKFDYNQEITDVCSYVDLEKNKTFKGRYIVNLYSGTTKISSTIFNYN